MLPTINEIPTQDALTTEFYGLNQTEKCSDAEFMDMAEMTSDAFPYIKPRNDREVRVYENKANNFYGGIVYGDDYYSVHKEFIDNENNYRLYKNFEPVVVEGEYVTLKYDYSPRQIVKFGAYLFIYPDNILYNPEDNTVEQLDYSVTLDSETAALYVSDKDGTPYILDDVTTFTAPGGFNNLLATLYTNTVRTVDAGVSTAISNSFYKNLYSLYCGTRSQEYQVGDPLNLYKLNICMNQPSKCLDLYQSHTTYPLYLLRHENNEIILSKYNSNQKAWLPAETYITLRITLGAYENFYSNVKVGDFIKIKPKKANGDEYTNTDFLNKQFTFELIQYLSGGVKVEKIVKGNSSVLMVFADRNMLKAINEKANGIRTGEIDIGGGGGGTPEMIQVPVYMKNLFYLTGNDADSLCAQVSIEKKVPEMDYITVSSNRIWGCSSDNHEIYACKQGDASNWYSYAGLANDSYAVTIASEEKFTGAVTLNETPYFFKENMAYAIFGNKPKNYQVQQIKCRGVEDGAYRSIAQKDGVVYYKSRESIERFNGNNSTSLSENLNLEAFTGYLSNSVIGHNKYYVYLNTDNGNDTMMLFVYDIKRGLWHKESTDDYVNQLININGNVYLFQRTGGMSSTTYLIKTLAKPAADKLNLIDPNSTEGSVWFVESGEFNAGSIYNKYITKFMFELKIAPLSKVAIQFSYDDTDEWETVFRSTDRHAKRTVKVPITPKRCERMKYRISGMGQAKIYSVMRTIEGGSENGTKEY